MPLYVGYDPSRWHAGGTDDRSRAIGGFATAGRAAS